MTGEEQPSGARTLAACACAALAAGTGAAVAIWWQMSGANAFGLVVLTLTIALPIAAAHAFLLGLPPYLLLRRRWRLRWWSAALGGFVVAAVPAGLLIFLPDNRMNLTAVRELAEFGLFGLLGGVAFWIVLRDPQSHSF